MKRIYVLLAVLMLLATPAYAEQANWKEFPSQVNVPIDKVWTVKFNRAIDPESTKDAVYVLDAQEKAINIVSRISSDKKSITVDAVPDYTPGGNYVLCIWHTIKTGDTYLKQPCYLSFSAKQLSQTEQYIAELRAGKHDLTPPDLPPGMTWMPTKYTIFCYIDNLRIEMQIHQLRYEPEIIFQQKVQELTPSATAFSGARKFRSICLGLTYGQFTDEDALQQLDSLEWEMILENLE